MQYRLEIAKPCHENWEAMTPVEQGRHCGHCCKTVVDFTGMNAEEIAAYFFTHKQDRTCGRFNTDQLKQNYISPDTYLEQLGQSSLPFLKRVAAILLFVFCVSVQQTHAQHQPGKHQPKPYPQQVKGRVKPQERQPVKDTVQKQPEKPTDQVIMGAVALPKPVEPVPVRKGEVQVLPTEKKKKKK